MDDIVIAPEEHALRERVLGALRGQSHTRTHVTAAEFSRAISAFKLHFGHPIVDRIMLQCKIGDDGQVDFSRFADDVAVRAGSHASATGAPSPSAGSVAGSVGFAAESGATARRGYEFRTALEATVGTSLPASVPQELLSLPQPERVRRLGKQISALFTKLDTGMMTLDQFRAGLRDLSIIEPPEVTRLLQQTPIQFSTLFRALQNEPPSKGPEPTVALYRPATSATYRVLGSPDGPAFTGRGRRIGPRPGEAGFNPVTWEGTPETTAERDRAAFTSPYNTAVQSNILSTVERGKAREMTDHMEESGASALIYGRGPVAKGADYGPLVDPDYRHDKKVSKMGVGDRGMYELLGESGAGKLIHSGIGAVAPDAHFETAMQAAQRTGLYGKEDTTHRPVTSAGYRTADSGLVREQVYSAVRQLDAGKLSARAFRDHLAALQIEVPPAVERLLQRYDTHGTADFGQFVKAFEEYFAVRTRAAADAASSSPRSAAPWGGSAVTRDQMIAHDDRADLTVPVRPDSGYRASADDETFTHGHTSGGTYFSTHINPLNRGHGDILGWSTPATGGEYTDKGRRVPSRALYDSYSLGADELRGLDRVRYQRGDILSFSVHDREQRAPRPHRSENQGTGNIIAWAGGAFAPEEAAREAAELGRHSRARVSTPLAEKSRSHQAPFAVDH